MKRVGILGGTFDPPHFGHLIIAEEARLALNLEEIWFVPSQEPPHKSKAFIRAKDRVEMVKKAIECNPHFKLNTIEVDRLGKSYTVDTLNILKENHPDVAFYFIIGGDMVEYLPKWHKIDELMNMVTFVGVKRVGFNLTTPYPVKQVDIPYVEISSTMIRERLYHSTPVTYFVPESVIDYIKEQRLYVERRSD